MATYGEGIEQIQDTEAWDQLIQRSHDKPVVVFKHSVTCGISAGALRRYREYVEAASSSADSAVDFTLLEVQNARPLSNAIAEATGIRHQSPQAILLRDGEAVWNDSHGRITGEALAEALASGSGDS